MRLLPDHRLWNWRHRIRGFLVCLFVLFCGLQSRLLQLLEKEIQQQQQQQPLTRKPPAYLNLCQQLLQGRETSTTASVWLSYKDQLLNGLIHPQDEQHWHKPWIDDLLTFLTPLQLKQTVLPHTDPSILRSLQIKLQNRLTNPTIYPKVKVFVFGGSIVEGSGCDTLPPVYFWNDRRQKLLYRSFQDCAWPNRLQLLADVFLPDAIHVVNLAVGGTHSRAAVPILEHWLLPQMGPNGPDIIVNAYAANDNLPPAYHNTHNTTTDNFHKYRIFKRLVEFVTTAARSRNDCQMPWIIFVNDYLGNQQESLMGESTLDEMVQLLVESSTSSSTSSTSSSTSSTSSSLSYVRPAHILSRYVWANTSEHVWSGVWKNKKGLPKVDVHYGTAGHVTTTIVLAYAFLQWGMDFCQEELFGMDDNGNDNANEKCTTILPQQQQQQQQQQQELEEMVHVDLPSKEWMKQHQPDRVLPNVTEGRITTLPIMTTSSSLSSSSSSSLLLCPLQEYDQHHQCIFGFLAAPLGTHSEKGPLEDYINQFVVTTNDGWVVQNNFRHGGFQNKLGLVATRPGAKLQLTFPTTATTTATTSVATTLARTTRKRNTLIQKKKNKKNMKLTIQYLKSYGSEWAESRVEGTIQVQQHSGRGVVVQEQRFQMEGYHDQNVSISYTYVASDIIVDAAAASNIAATDNTTTNGDEEEIQLTLELVGGTTFKINAMMICG
jgi:hypothetical protein